MSTLAHRKGVGFTLIELLVTIAIAVILLTIAAPSLTSFQRSSQLTAAANTFLAALTSARSEAMKSQLYAFVRPGDNANWASGWIAYVDNDWSLSYTQGVDTTLIYPSTPLPAGITVTSSSCLQSDGIGSYITFSGAGYIIQDNGAPLSCQGSGIAITFTNSAGSRQVIMQPSGRIRVCNPATDTTCNTNF